MPNASQIVENERVRLASELYSHSHFETSIKARFLSQMTVLEVLSERPQQPQNLQALIDKWVGEIGEIQERSKDPDEKRSLERLKSRMLGLKEESITESVRVLVGKALTAMRDPKASELVARVGLLYGFRSKIVHGGPVVLGQAPTELQEVVGKTLRAVMKQPSLLSQSEKDS